MLGAALLWVIIALLTATPSFAHRLFRGGIQAGTEIDSIQLSGSSVQFGASGPYYVGTLTTNLSPQTPTFNNLSGATYSLVSSGGSCSGGDTTHFQIIGDGVYTNTLAAGTYKLCVTASASPVAPITGTFPGITEGHKIDAVASYCAANGGGNGSSGTPWHSACIQAALNAAVPGDTVFLAAGNWSLSSTQVTSSQGGITLTGAGSGNTFDAYGHPNNGTAASGTYTRVATDTVYGAAKGLEFNSCVPAALTVSHIFFDGSLDTAGGNTNGTLAIVSCYNTSIDDIRVWSYIEASISSETQFFVLWSNNTSLQNSVIAEPISPSTGQYSGTEIFQVQELGPLLVQNNLFYQQSANPIYVDNMQFIGNTTVMKDDGIASSNVLQGFGDTGCSNGGCTANGGFTGSYHFYVYNNLFDGGTNNPFETGGGVNDPSTSGIVNDLKWIGNTLLGTAVAIDSCEWHFYGFCAANVVTSGTEGMQVNGFAVSNNSLIGTTAAWLSAKGTGCTTQGSGPTCPSSSLTNMTVVNFDAHQNYLSSPSNLYANDAYTITPSVSNNVGLDIGSITSGPSCAFTLDLLSGSTVSFATTTFAAQYGSVRWLASTTATAPTSGGQAGTGKAWSYLPPASLAATHGDTVYLWVMDSANNISASATRVVP